jgi:hypothetical protein
MKKGIIYIMTTAVSGLVKIGKTNNFQDRMNFLEKNGYCNVTGLKRFFAIELEDYEEKESLLHDIFKKHQVGDSELFALDQDLIYQLLLSFDGKVIYPENINQEKEFENVSIIRKQGELFSFYKKGLKNGDKITFIKDKSIFATVYGDREVEYQGRIWKLSPLTRSIFEQRGELNTSGAYQGSAYFEFNGKKLREIPDHIYDFQN